MSKLRLREYVERSEKRNGVFVPRPRQAAYAFGLINRAMFNDCLSRTEIQIRKLRGVWGWCYGDLHTQKNDWIAINDSFPNKTHFIRVLAHEMVHQYQIEQLGQIDHGMTFEDWNSKFRKIGIHIKKED